MGNNISSEQVTNTSYDQATVENKTATATVQKSASSTGSSSGTQSRDALSETSQLGVQKANVGFQIAFKVKLVGRIPAGATSC